MHRTRAPALEKMHGNTFAYRTFQIPSDRQYGLPVLFSADTLISDCPAALFRQLGIKL